MKRASLLFALALLASLPLLSCKGAKKSTPTDGDSGQPDAGPADAGDDADADHWSCGSAAGLCSCTKASVATSARTCSSASCCYANASDCRCKLADSAPSCDALAASVPGSEAVESCPPPPGP